MDEQRIEIDPKEFSSDKILETYQALNEIDWGIEDEKNLYLDEIKLDEDLDYQNDE